MAVDSDTVRQMATLARLKIPDQEIKPLAKEMDSILNFMGEIKRWEGDAAPFVRPTIRRPDVASTSNGSALIEAAAEHEEGQVVVPPIKGAS